MALTNARRASNLDVPAMEDFDHMVLRRIISGEIRQRPQEAVLRNISLSLALGVGLICSAPRGYAVDYVKQCTQVGNQTPGPGFYYIPGTDSCFNPTTGEVLEPIAISDTVAVVWKTLMPYPRGQWTTNPAQTCQGSLVKVGSFKSTDFTPDAFLKLRTPPFSLQLQPSQMITGVIMQGGFYDPRAPSRAGDGVTFGFGLCLRSIDSSVFETQPGGSPINPPYGDGGYPIGCIENEHIVGMPAAYAISATSAYPNIDAYFVNGNNQPPVGGPYTYGKQLVVTSDISAQRASSAFTYCTSATGCSGGVYDPTTQTYAPLSPGQLPLAGTLSVWACVEGGSGNGNSQGGNGNGNSQ